MSIGFHFLNLKRRVDRKYTMWGNLLTQGVPVEDVTFHEAIDGMDYDNVEQVRDAAEADGFPELQKIGGNVGDLCCMWGTAKILKAIRDDPKHEVGYYNQDDKLLVLRYEKLLEVVHTVYNHPHVVETYGKFLFLQLSWFTKPYGEKEKERKPIFPTSMICENILGTGDSGLLMSRDGADYLIKMYEKTPDILEVLIGELKDVPGTFSIFHTEYAIKSVDTRIFGHEKWEDDQDRILVNKEKAK